LKGHRSPNHGGSRRQCRCRNEVGGEKSPIQPSTRVVCRWRVQQSLAPDLAAQARHNTQNPPTTSHRRPDLRAVRHLKKERTVNREKDSIDLRRKNKIKTSAYVFFCCRSPSVRKVKRGGNRCRSPLSPVFFAATHEPTSRQ